MSPLHYSDAGDRTFCGRVRLDVDFWAAPDVAVHMSFTQHCKSCQRVYRARGASS